MPTGTDTVAALEDHYGKLLALVIRKYRLTDVVLSAADIEAAARGGCNLIVQELEDGLHIRVVGDDEARRLQKLELTMNPQSRCGRHRNRANSESKKRCILRAGHAGHCDFGD